MKKLITAVALLGATTVSSAHTVGGHDAWSLVIGGTIGYVMANQQRPVVVQPAPVVVSPPVYINSSPVYNLPQAPYYGATPIYERRNQWDPACNCYVVIYNQIGWK